MPYPLRNRPARMFPNVQAIHCLRFQVNMVVPAPDGSGLTPIANRAIIQNKSIPLGTIPAGSIVLGVDLHVLTAFNGTTPAFRIGDATVTDSILTDAASAVTVAGVKYNLTTGVAVGIMDNETPLFIRLNGTGATAGRLDGVVKYYHNVE